VAPAGVGSRKAAVEEFVLAVKGAQAAGRLRKKPAPQNPAARDDLVTDVMKIPFFPKPAAGHHDCAPVCLRMALAYFGIEMKLSDIYSASGSLGQTHYTLPWGICLVAAKANLYATFISKHPQELINANDVAIASGMTVDDVRRVIQEQLAECCASERIALVTYDANTHPSLPASAVAVKSGVVIPSLHWNAGDVHNVVLTGFEDSCVTYHDPNAGANRTMSRMEFLKRWCDVHTDNDLLIISKDPAKENI
jgi:Papain-like cysteine protease AvrRpt2